MICMFQMVIRTPHISRLCAGIGTNTPESTEVLLIGFYEPCDTEPRHTKVHRFAKRDSVGHLHASNASIFL